MTPGDQSIALYEPPPPLRRLSTAEGRAVLEFAPADLNLLRETLTKDLDPAEFELFIRACKHTGLDPFHKQIHAIKRGGRLTIQTSIDGFRLIAERTEHYAPGRETTYTYDEAGRLASATAYVKKYAGGVWHEVAETAHWSEYCPAKGQDHMWRKMPHVMLAKVAEARALRRAFPADLSGVYSADEMDQAVEIEVPDSPPSRDGGEVTMKALQARFSGLGFTDRALRLDFAGRFLSTRPPLSSFTELEDAERLVVMKCVTYCAKMLPEDVVVYFAGFVKHFGLRLDSRECIARALADYVTERTADGSISADDGGSSSDQAE